MRRFNRKNNIENSPLFIRKVLLKIGEAVFPANTNKESEQQITQTIKFLRSLYHFGRDSKQIKSTKTGRKANFSREFILKNNSIVEEIIQSEFNQKISSRRFIAAYVPILNYPKDIQNALETSKINLTEAHTLARVKDKNLPIGSTKKASTIRAGLIKNHIERNGSQNELHRRVLESLNILPKAIIIQTSNSISELNEIADYFVAFNESDTTHLFWEEMKNLVFLLREIDTDLIDEETQNEVFNRIDSLSNLLIKYKRKQSLDDK